MRTFLIAMALSAPLDAFAARHEISFEYVGDIHGDEGVEQVVRSPVFHGLGLRGGGAVIQDRRHFGLVVDGGWTHARDATRISGSYADADYELSNPYYTAALAVDTVVVGLKGDYEVRNLFYPYVHAQVGVAIGSLSLDDDSSRDDNLNEFTRVGAAPVGLFGVGFELMIPDLPHNWPVTAGFFLEGGYEVAGNMRVGDAGGPINLSGGLLRTGLGLRFR